jgi:uncharacterized RDD family membrane protein YckC
LKNDCPDYSKYSIHELRDAYDHINKEKYPERTKLIEHEIEERRKNPTQPEKNIFDYYTSSILIKYDTFWRRFGAGIVDGFVLLPLSIIDKLVSNFISSYSILISWFIFYSFSFYIYSVLMHGKYGATVGKMIAKLKVIDVSEQKGVDYRQALLRDSIPIILNIIMILIILPMWRIKIGNFPISQEETKIFLIIMFIWSSLGILWFFTEILTMLTNKKRRAVHDYIARSVVIRTEYKT